MEYRVFFVMRKAPCVMVVICILSTVTLYVALEGLGVGIPKADILLWNRVLSFGQFTVSGKECFCKRESLIGKL